MFCRHRQNMSYLQIVRGHHFVGATNMVPAIPVTLPPWCAGLKFLNPSPFFWGQNAEALQKFLHLEIFWGFRTRTAAAGGGQYLTGGGGHRDSSRAAAGRAAGAGPVQTVPRAGREPRQAAGAEKKGGRGIDKASSSLAYGYTAKSICRVGKESDPSGSWPRWAGFGPFGGRGWC